MTESRKGAMSKGIINRFRDRTSALLNSRMAGVVELLIVGLVLIPYTITLLVLFLAWLLFFLRRMRWADIGWSKPRNWPMIFLIAIPVGFGWPLLDIYVVEPWIEQLTGTRVDLSAFVGMEGNIVAYLFYMGLVWTFAAFGEEMLFRGYILHRVNQVVGKGLHGTIAALVLSSVMFGAAHMYQGIPGVIETGYVGIGLGILFFASGRNLWLPIIVHGVYDTVGMTLLYLGKYPGV